jgi:hypothetical protein
MDTLFHEFFLGFLTMWFYGEFAMKYLLCKANHLALETLLQREFLVLK